jgi:hypothetical protein
MEKIEIDKAIIEIRQQIKFLEDLEAKLRATNNFPDTIKAYTLGHIFETVCLLGDTAETLQLIEIDDWQGWENRDKRATDDEVFVNSKIIELSARIFLDALSIQKMIDSYPKDKIGDKKRIKAAIETMERIKELAHEIDDPAEFCKKYP